MDTRSEFPARRRQRPTATAVVSFENRIGRSPCARTILPTLFMPTLVYSFRGDLTAVRTHTHTHIRAHARAHGVPAMPRERREEREAGDVQVWVEFAVRNVETVNSLGSRQPLLSNMPYARLYSKTPRYKPRGRFNPRRFESRAKVYLHSPVKYLEREWNLRIRPFLPTVPYGVAE